MAGSQWQNRTAAEALYENPLALRRAL